MASSVERMWNVVSSAAVAFKYGRGTTERQISEDPAYFFMVRTGSAKAVPDLGRGGSSKKQQGGGEAVPRTPGPGGRRRGPGVSACREWGGYETFCGDPWEGGVGPPPGT